MLVVIDIKEDQVDRWGYLHFHASPNKKFDPALPPSEENPMYNLRFHDEFSLPGFEFHTKEDTNIFTINVMPSQPEPVEPHLTIEDDKG